MTALAATRQTKVLVAGDTQGYLAADSVTFYHGAIVMVDSAGLLKPAAAEASNKGCVGVCQLTPAGGFAGGSKASGTGGDVWIPVLEGVFEFAADTLEQADVQGLVYADDDQTIDETQATNAPVAGNLVRFNSATSGNVYISWKRT